DHRADAMDAEVVHDRTVRVDGLRADPGAGPLDVVHRQLRKIVARGRHEGATGEAGVELADARTPMPARQPPESRPQQRVPDIAKGDGPAGGGLAGQRE